MFPMIPQLTIPRATRDSALCSRLRPLVVRPQYLQDRRGVLGTFHRVADVASRARPVRSCPASGEQPLAHLLRDRQVGDQVTVDVPDLTPPVAKRYGAKPARTRARPRPAENIVLHQRQKIIVHSSSPLRFTALLADLMDRIVSPDTGRKYSFLPLPCYGLGM